MQAHTEGTHAWGEAQKLAAMPGTPEGRSERRSGGKAGRGRRRCAVDHGCLYVTEFEMKGAWQRSGACRGQAPPPRALAASVGSGCGLESCGLCVQSERSSAGWPGAASASGAGRRRVAAGTAWTAAPCLHAVWSSSCCIGLDSNWWCWSGCLKLLHCDIYIADSLRCALHLQAADCRCCRRSCRAFIPLHKALPTELPDAANGTYV